MIVKVLAENTSLSKDFGCEHGLSLYIEANSHKILFDVGASGLFLENAKKLNVSISDIDYLVISHGHYDHGGGLSTFFKENTKAEAFLHPLAFEKHHARRLNDTLEDIGLEAELKEHGQIVLTYDRFFINRGIQVFSNIPQNKPIPTSNSGLLVEQRGQMVQDHFAHEQNLIIEENGTMLLVTGCAHNGIVNILEHFQALRGRMPDYVIGGLHLSRPSAGNESSEAIERIGSFLLDTKAKYYTCHCTGIKPYQQLKALMGERIDYLSAGAEITI